MTQDEQHDIDTQKKTIRAQWRRLPRWLRVVIGTLLIFFISFSICILAGPAVSRYYLESDQSCLVEVEPGTPVTYNSTGTDLFTFPEIRECIKENLNNNFFGR